MTESYLRQSPLAHLSLAARVTNAPGEAGVLLCERPFRAQINLRGEVAAKRFRDAVETAAGVVSPRQPNTVAKAGDVTVLWLGPDEWLIVAPDERKEEMIGTLRDTLGAQHAAVTDVSEARTVIGLAGAKAREVMMKSCSLDLHPSVFAPGQCAQSTLAKAQIILHQVDDGPTYDLYVARSFAEYLWAWLEDASLEYGMAVVVG
jgi:sarcosine oxidase subunit gamma